MKRVVMIGHEDRRMWTWLTYFLEMQPYEIQLDIVTTDAGLKLLKKDVSDVTAFIVMETFLDDALERWLEKHPCRHVVVLGDMDTGRLIQARVVSDIETLPHIVVQTHLPVLVSRERALATKVVVVTSVIGGCGTTSIARACVRELEKQGIAAIYVETHAFCQFNGAYDHVPTERLLQTLEKGMYAQYQVVVIDMTWCHQWEEIIAVADKVCIVTTGDERSSRTQRLLERLEVQDKYMLIDNVVMKSTRFIYEKNWQYCCVTQTDIENRLPSQLIWWLQGGLTCM